MGLSCRSCFSLYFSSLCRLLVAIIHLLSFTVLSATFAIGNANNQTDRLALLDFKDKITDDPLGVVSSWNRSLHFCKWYGITCSRRHQRVTRLDLSSLKLSGSISPYVGNLSFLRELYLENNSFSYEIPPQIGHLRRLQSLSLYNNSISGEIPSNISACSNLVYLYLDGNNLVGEIPEELTSLMKLEYFFLGKNNLIGTIPQSLRNLSSIDTFSAYRNKLHGVLPESFGRLMNLRILTLYDNQFSGNIPSSIFNLSSIESIDVGINHLHGTLPMTLVISLPHLNFFSIGQNQFTGSIPTSISNASNLEILQLNQNSLTGTVPSLEKLNKMFFLGIAGNHLGGGRTNDLKFLSDLTNATALRLLNINDNNFGGKLPEHLSNFSKKLELLALNDNQIHGNLPAGIEFLVNLTILSVSSNKLSGTIPSSIGKLKNLRELYMHDNNFSGSIPSSLGNLINLIHILLYYNNLQGMIPSSLANCKSLLILDLSNNNLTGLIPRRLFELSSLSVSLDLSNNRLYGSLPNEVGNLKQLGSLALEYNMLSGTVPIEGIFKIASATSIEGNKNLCGGILAAALVLTCLSIWRLRKSKRESTSSSFENALLRLSYQNLLKATNGFSSDNLIGSGGFGTRLNIAIDVACALEYLHCHSGTTIVHCDPKPSNLLLDKEMSGHDGNIDFCTNQSNSVGARGTIGYCPPEYGLGSNISTSGDIFSFGILLLEMFTGKRPTHDMFTEGLSLHNFVKGALPEQVTKIIDPCMLRVQLSEDATSNHQRDMRNRRKDKLIECLTPIFEIGISCSAESPQERMNISDVLAQLSSVRNRFLGTRLPRQREDSRTLQ
ncbi:serine-threonine protein kinase, plant-type, putative [Ricinus communis]|uniref:non-specific serine/threonine protein kinase n=1 Tax=Ricinus communis TaxID=3988 RepID=B9SS80_RICCO|nr:serine-threonine protein kinase, plant-type, putative [Ricinus communis]